MPRNHFSPMKAAEPVKIEKEEAGEEKANEGEQCEQCQVPKYNIAEDNSIEAAFERQKALAHLPGPKLCNKYDMIMLILVIVAVGFVWVVIYKQPIPKVILGIFGVDDTVYPEMVKNQ